MKTTLLLTAVLLASTMWQPVLPATLNTVPSSIELANSSDAVMFNWSNRKYHNPSCIWACRCTVHCIEITFESPLISIGIVMLNPGPLIARFPEICVFAFSSIIKPVRMSITIFDLLNPFRSS